VRALLEIMYFDIETDEHCVEYTEVVLGGTDKEPTMILLRNQRGQDDRRAIIHLCDDVDKKYHELKSK